MIEERDGWFVVNVKDGHWYENASFGKVCNFESQENRFPQTGVRIYVLDPGKPNGKDIFVRTSPNILKYFGCSAFHGKPLCRRSAGYKEEHGT